MDWEQLTIHMDLVQAEARLLAHDVRNKRIWDGSEFQDRANRILLALERARQVAGDHKNL